MKATIKNTSKAPQGVHTVDGLVFIEPGHQRTVIVHPDHAERTKRSSLLSVEVRDETEASPEPATADGPSAPPAEFDPDLIDAMTDEELRAFIQNRDGRAPHPNTGREKLLARAKGDAAE
jgi:hypothetical protein